MATGVGQASGPPGNRPSALLIPGAGGGGWEWRAWARVLGARGIEAHCPDLVPAAAGLAATGFDDYLGQVTRHGVALPRPLLLGGASLGGLLALAAARELEPAGLVLINPVPPAGVPDWPPRGRTWPDVVPWGDDADFRGTLRAMPDCDHGSRELAYRRWRNESGRVMRCADAGVDVAPPGVPALVLASEADGDVPPGVSRALAERLGADFVLVPGASHLGPLLGASAVGTAELAAAWFGGLGHQQS